MTIPALVYVDSTNPRAESVYNQMIENNEIVHVKNVNDAKSLIAIGGDGTLIHALRYYRNLPANFTVMLVGTGTINYLAIDANPISSIIHRMNVAIGGNFVNNAINEVSIRSLDISSMIKLNIYIDDELVCENMRGDGVIIATAVGSTAYAMSAGGPIIDIGTPVNVIVPNNEYSRYSRPIVLSNDRKIVIESNDTFNISLDGINISDCNADEDITITKGDALTLLHANTLSREEKKR